VILNLARIVEQKGQECLVLAFLQMVERHPDAALEIAGGVGDETHAQRLRALADHPALRGKVFLLPQQEDPRTLLGAATVYAQPSFVEGIPNAVIEALIDGAPCVATNVGGLPKIVDDNVSGILVSKGNPRQLGKALGRILDSKDLGTKLVRQAKRSASAFDIDRRAEELEAILPAPEKAVLSSRKPTRAVAQRRIRNCTRRILVTQSERFGDQIQSFAFLVARRRAFPKREITILVPTEQRRLYRHLGLDHIFGIESKSSLTFIGRQAYDLGFDLNLDPDQNLLVDEPIDRLVSFPKNSPGASQSFHDIVVHEPLWKSMLGLLRTIGVSDPVVFWSDVQPVPSRKERQSAGQLLGRKNGALRVSLSPSGFSPGGKQWPVDRFADVVNTLSETCPILPVLLGHPTEVPLTWLLESLIKPPCLNVSKCYGGLGGPIGVLSRLDFHLANDNGVMHLADLMDVPQVALFGPTNPRFFGPMGNRTTVVSSEDGTIESIEVEDVLKAVSVRMET
tara:strand:- start:450 stop:1976 length:1527 start_codon:yes stop_codon:yes gene_type:complete